MKMKIVVWNLICPNVHLVSPICMLPPQHWSTASWFLITTEAHIIQTMHATTPNHSMMISFCIPVSKYGNRFHQGMLTVTVPLSRIKVYVPAFLLQWISILCLILNVVAMVITVNEITLPCSFLVSVILKISSSLLDHLQNHCLLEFQLIVTVLSMLILLYFSLHNLIIVMSFF